MVTKWIGRLKHESHDYGMYKISRLKTLGSVWIQFILMKTKNNKKVTAHWPGTVHWPKCTSSKKDKKNANANARNPSAHFMRINISVARWISEPHIIIHLLNDCFSYFIYIKKKILLQFMINTTITCMQQSWMHSFINLRNHYKKETFVHKEFAIIPNKNNCKIVTT